ncbi:SH3 domain-containing protein [Methylocella tundrae]|uniref:SH3 domain-containing protein n=1 Tax=Methylocella tundrae TaxID=227605 RepID=UPI0030FE1130|nr:SH3 domain-containing protein [Methylocella tundrae]
MKILSLSLLTGLALAGTLASAKAQTAVSLDLANLRSGPGTGYAVITTVPPNAPLNILRCRNSWCRVSWQGQTGYIAASLLGRTRGSFVAAAPPPATVYVGPSVVVGGPYIDPYWDDWGYGWGGGWGPGLGLGLGWGGGWGGGWGPGWRGGWSRGGWGGRGGWAGRGGFGRPGFARGGFGGFRGGGFHGGFGGFHGGGFHGGGRR